MKMVGARCFRVIALVSLFGATSYLQAAVITYATNNVTADTWEVSYTVTNDTLGFALEEFSIFFAVGLYENISALSTPADWDPLVLQPDIVLPDDGLYDALAISGGGIAAGDSLGAFSVQVDFLGAGAPGAQFFTIVDPLTFDTLEEGMTVAAVPLPAALWLFAGGLSLLAGLGNKARASRT